MSCVGDLGYGHRETIGDDETPASARALNVGVAKVTQLALGRAHTCARLEDGNLRCWGEGQWGQLGHGKISDACIPQPELEFTCADGTECCVGDDEIPGAVNVVPFYESPERAGSKSASA